MSLRHKLVLLLTALSLVAVGIAMAAAYGDVRQAAAMAADERLGRVSQQLAGLVQASTNARAERYRAVGTHPALRAAVRGVPPDTAAIVDALDVLRNASDSALAIRIVDRELRPVFTDLAGDHPLPERAPPLDTLATYGNLGVAEGEVRYWFTGPVWAEDGTILGWVVQERRLGPSQSAEQIEQLIGPTSRAAFVIPGESVGATLSGEPLPVPAEGLVPDSLLTLEHDGIPHLARLAGVPSTPWAVLVEVPTSTVRARSAAFLRRMGGLALLLLLGTMAVAYSLGRRLTAPIERLVVATEAVARGDYREVDASRGGDELHRLARSFNEMAGKVAASRAALEERLREQQALARRLEEASARAEEAREAAQHANRAKADFLATMSHEVRTPINAMVGYCDLLEMELSGPLTPEQREKVERIRRSSVTLVSLVEDVLDFAKLDTGQLRLDMTNASVRDAVLAASVVLQPQAEREGLSLDISVAPDLTFEGDPKRVEQILVNLISNAVKFTEEGGVVIRADIGNEGPPTSRRANRPPIEGGWVRLDVEDTGEGISREQQARVFEPFVQGESGYTRRYGGTGLGLSISRELALMMGGDLTVRSAVGEGSCFTLWLRPGRREAGSSRAVESDGDAGSGHAGGAAGGAAAGVMRPRS